MIYSLDKRFQDITPKEVEKTLGKPDKKEHYEDGDELIYKAVKHTLRFVFSNEVEVL